MTRWRRSGAGSRRCERRRLGQGLHGGCPWPSFAHACSGSEPLQCVAPARRRPGGRSGRPADGGGSTLRRPRRWPTVRSVDSRSRRCARRGRRRPRLSRRRPQTRRRRRRRLLLPRRRLRRTGHHRWLVILRLRLMILHRASGARAGSWGARDRRRPASGGDPVRDLRCGFLRSRRCLRVRPRYAFPRGRRSPFELVSRPRGGGAGERGAARAAACDAARVVGCGRSCLEVRARSSTTRRSRRCGCEGILAPYVERAGVSLCRGRGRPGGGASGAGGGSGASRCSPTSRTPTRTTISLVGRAGLRGRGTRASEECWGAGAREP